MPAANGHSYPNRRQTAAEISTPPMAGAPEVAEAPVAIAQEVEEPAPVIEAVQPVINAPVNGTNGTVDKNNGTNGHHKTEPIENGWKFDPLREIPTLAHQQAVKELNEVMATPASSSLNEKLKAEVKEVAHVLNDAPVRDLRRAIGINDRFVFISELFRNDEVMYERSIKTINGFRILPEAQYWIERELKVKLGWDENKESTRHFYQLVKRRFS
jgi:hypothetical protein